MKKLYYLDESEKDRILHLHESRTKDQYLLTEQKDKPSREEFNNRIRTACLSSKFVEPSAPVFNYFWQNFSNRNRTSYFDDSSLNDLKKEIEKLKTFDKFCSLNKRFVDTGGYSKLVPQGDLIFGMSKFIYADSRWNSKVKEPLAGLMDTTNLVGITSGVAVSGTAAGGGGGGGTGGSSTAAGGGGGGGAYYQVAGGYVFNSAMTPEALQAIRTKIGSKDTAKTLTQNDINLIYQTLV